LARFSFAQTISCHQRFYGVNNNPFVDCIELVYSNFRLALTKLDILNDFAEIQIATAYKMDNRNIVSPPGWNIRYIYLFENQLF
jgi:adenylosuccinate synthase